MELSINRVIEIALIILIVIIAAVILVKMINNAGEGASDLKLNSTKLGFGAADTKMAEKRFETIESFIYNCIHKCISRGANL